MSKANQKGRRQSTAATVAEVHRRYRERDEAADNGRQLLLAALARKYGELDGLGGRRLILTEAELQAQEGERLTVQHGANGEKGLTVIVDREQPEPAPTTPTVEPATDGAPVSEPVEGA